MKRDWKENVYAALVGIVIVAIFVGVVAVWHQGTSECRDQGGVYAKTGFGYKCVKVLDK